MLDSLDTLIGFALIFTIVSLLITILVQIVASVLNLRGRNLLWGVAEAFEAIAPELKAKAEGGGMELAEHLLKDSLISDSQIGQWVGTAKAVRAKELFALLHSIAIGKKPDTPPEMKNHVITLFKNLGVPASVFELVESEKTKLEALKDDIAKQLANLPDGPAKEQLQKTKAEIEGKLANAAAYAQDVATRWVAQGEAEIQRIYEQFEHWFETGQERSQEWFTTHARIITAVLGLIAAFFLQLDTVEIYSFISSNREVRESLVAQAKTVLDQGEKVLKERPNVLRTALTATSGTNATLTNIAISANDTTGAIKAKIRDAYTNHSPEEVDQLLENFDHQVANTVKSNLTEFSGEYNSMAKSLDKTGFDLFPKERWRWKNEAGTAGVIFRRHLLGMVFSALLLSLGAPFWFNLLKGLASLRSTVAKNISDEEKAEQKNTGPQDTAKPPPTATR